MKRALVILIFTIGYLFSFAQNQTDSLSLYQISTNDGNTFIGFIIAENAQEIELKTLIYGVVNIPKLVIISKKNLSHKQAVRKKAVPVKLSTNDTTQLYNIITKDGYDFTGTIRNETDKKLDFKTSNYGIVTIQRVNIKTIQKISDSQIINGDTWVENPQSSRYYFGPNGYALKKEEGYYQNIMVLVNQISYGFSDYFTMGVGTIPVFLMGGDVVPLWITPKFSFPIIENRFNAATGVFAGSILGEESSFALPYASVTLGSKDKNLTLSGGYFAANGEMSDNPIISFSTMLRMSKKSYFISENFLFTSDDSFFLGSFGIRTVWTKSSLDYGFIIPFGEGFIAIPWIGIVVPF